MQHSILLQIYKNRALTNEHLRMLLYSHLNSNLQGQKANISRMVKELREKKMIDSQSCYPYSKELIHFLTSLGIEYCLDHLHVVTNTNKLTGFYDEHGIFDYKTLKPPLNNIEHLMLYLDTVIGISKGNHPVRHNLYAARSYNYVKQTSEYRLESNGKIRPDGEVLAGSVIYALEVDTGTERLEHLIKKFSRYRKFFDYQKANGLDKYWSGIIFSNKYPSDSPLVKDIRWQTIIKAACIGLKEYAWDTEVFGLACGNEKVLPDLLLNKPELLRELNIPIPIRKNKKTD